jgi:hypothetical protein
MALNIIQNIKENKKSSSIIFILVLIIIGLSIKVYQETKDPVIKYNPRTNSVNRILYEDCVRKASAFKEKSIADITNCENLYLK